MQLLAALHGYIVELTPEQQVAGKLKQLIGPCSVDLLGFAGPCCGDTRCSL